MKSAPVIQIMLCVVIFALAIISVAFYFGEADWTWMGEQMASYILILIVLGVGIFTLMGWLSKK